VFLSLRRLRATWVKVYLHKTPAIVTSSFDADMRMPRKAKVPIQAEIILSREVSATLRTAMDAGATTEQIHRAMDEAQQIAFRRNKAHFIRR